MSRLIKISFSTFFALTVFTLFAIVFPTSNIIPKTVASGYTCSQYGGTCRNGPAPYGYRYVSYYSCNPSYYDGCAVRCPANQACTSRNAGGMVPNGNCGWKYCPTTIHTRPYYPYPHWW